MRLQDIRDQDTPHVLLEKTIQYVSVLYVANHRTQHKRNRFPFRFRQCVDTASRRLLRGLHCERVHPRPILDGLLLGLRFGYHREKARDHRRSIGYCGAVADIRSVRQVRVRSFVEVGVHVLTRLVVSKSKGSSKKGVDRRARRVHTTTVDQPSATRKNNWSRDSPHCLHKISSK